MEKDAGVWRFGWDKSKLHRLTMPGRGAVVCEAEKEGEAAKRRGMVTPKTRAVGERKKASATFPTALIGRTAEGTAGLVGRTARGETAETMNLCHLASGLQVRVVGDAADGSLQLLLVDEEDVLPSWTKGSALRYGPAGFSKESSRLGQLRRHAIALDFRVAEAILQGRRETDCQVRQRKGQSIWIGLPLRSDCSHFQALDHPHSLQCTAEGKPKGTRLTPSKGVPG